MISMKKQLFLFVLLAQAIILTAQPRQKDPFKNADYKIAMKAAMLDITSEKDIAELGETFALTVTMVVTDPDGNATKMDYRPEDPATAPWFVQDWKIVEGGGTLKSAPGSGNNYYAMLTTPQQLPPNKCVVVEVTMHSLDKNYPETILRTTIYLEAHNNVFYVNCPFLHINHEKWVINENETPAPGIPVAPGTGPGNVGAETDARQKAALQRIQLAQAQKRASAMNIDLASVMANCKAVYSSEEKTTAITLMGGILDAVNGKSSGTKNNFMIVISVPGRSMDRYIIGKKKNITVAVTLPLMNTACGCSDDPEWKAEREKNGEKGPTCNGGFIQIDQLVFGKDGFVSGYFKANLESQSEKGETFYMDIEGKFRAKLVN